jgi:hypothetical protein
MVANTLPPPRPAFKVAANGSSRRRSNNPGVATEGPKENPWKPWYAWRPKQVNGIWYWHKWIYRRWVLSPGGGFYQYGDSFDYIRGD